MEWLWACLLMVAFLCRETRPLACILGLKWLANYAVFDFIEWAPVFIDMAAAVVAVLWYAHRPNPYTDAALAGFILTALVHGAYWPLWYDVGATGASLYYHSVIALFTAMTLAAAAPGGMEGGRTLCRWLRSDGWSGLVGLVSPLSKVWRRRSQSR